MPGVAAGDPLSSLHLYRVQLALRAPLVAAHGTESVRDVVLARWTGDGGVSGWGECPTLSTFGYADEITDTAWRFLCDTVGPVVDQTGDLPRVEGAPMAMGALRDAQLDARLRAAGRSLVDFVGGPTAPSAVATTRVVGIDAAEIPAGATRIKVKVTPADVDRLRTIRDRHPELELAADANGSFRSADDVPGWIDDLGLLYVEQPLPPAQLDGLAELTARLETPVALDESVTDLRSLREVIDAGALRVLSLKPARVGGVERAIELADVAAAAGLYGFVGGIRETGVGRATALALATHPACTLTTDLGPSDRYFERDITEPIEAVRAGSGSAGDGGEMLVVPDGVGIGREPDPVRLAGCTVDEAAFGLSG